MAPLAASWCLASASDIAAAVRRREVTAVEVALAHLARIDALDGALGCYLTVDREGALGAAAAVDAAVGRGEDPGPLCGVPVGIKDLLCTAGLRTTAGSRMLEHWVPPYDATAVARLRAAGAVLLGKLNLDEFAMGSSTENSAFHPTRNPWDLGRVPGGSSGASAAAVAAGLCALSLGTDTGGSIRQPAALSGCVGLKPTYGRVSRHGAIAFASSLDQIGPLARTALDCALGLEVIAGLDPLDATSLDQPVGALGAACAQPIAGLRVGLPTALLGEGLAPGVLAAVRAALDQLGALGAVTAEVALPNAPHWLPTYYLVAPAEASSNLARYDGVRYGLRVDDADLGRMYEKSRAAGLGWEVKRRIMLGTYALRAGYYDAYYLRAQKVRALIAADFARAFTGCDVIALPTSPVVAFPLGARLGDPLAMYLADVYTIAANLAGLPALSVPCGLSEGLPVGLQLIGPALGEATLLRAASAYQRATSFHTARPTGIAGLAALAEIAAS